MQHGTPTGNEHAHGTAPATSGLLILQPGSCWTCSLMRAHAAQFGTCGLQCQWRGATGGILPQPHSLHHDWVEGMHAHGQTKLQQDNGKVLVGLGSSVWAGVPHINIAQSQPSSQCLLHDLYHLISPLVRPPSASMIVHMELHCGCAPCTQLQGGCISPPHTHHTSCLIAM